VSDSHDLRDQAKAKDGEVRAWVADYLSRKIFSGEFSLTETSSLKQDFDSLPSNFIVDKQLDFL